MSHAKQFGWRCGMTGKHRFKSQAHADRRAEAIRNLKEQNLESYHCLHCDGWHLTKSSRQDLCGQDFEVSLNNQKQKQTNR